MKPTRTIPVAIILAGILLAGAIYFSMGGKLPSLSLHGRHGDPNAVRPVAASDHILGNPAAPVMIVEYADFDCEYCKGFADILREEIADAGATGQVALVYREFPLTELHPNALAEAQAAECAAKVGGNDAFWRFADLLFKHQPADPSTFGTLAEQAGITSNDAFASCYADATNQVDDAIQADRANALATGASGTPYSLILVNGKVADVVDGAYTYDALNMLIEQALANVRQ